MSIWTISGRDIFQLRGAGGELFLSFCDALLRAELARHGIPATNIATNQRSTKPDGGVDTKIDVPVPDTYSGWLTSPTSWQYKGTNASGALGEASLKKEIHKPFSEELIRRGFAYRFAICDDVPAPQRDKIDAFLTREARTLDPNAPPSRLVTASDLAAWASRYFALKVRFFNSELAGLLPISSWGPNITGATRTYVALQDRSETFAALRTHASLDRVPDRVEMVLEGEPGIGKTRLAYEALMHDGADQLVLYTSDERAAMMAVSTLANSDSAGILVADECSDFARASMASTLRGHRERVRLICINAPTSRSPFDGEQPWLAKMSTSDVDEILKINFPEVSADHRFAYRDLARGYIRLAIDLCQNDRVITERGLSVALRSVDDYLITRLSGGQQLEAAMAVSLFQRVGFRDEVADELASVAQFLALSLDDLHQQLRVIKNGPGFVAEAGRYYYVTPAIVAETLFARAWEKWAAGRDSSFLERAGALPKELFDSFLKRVSINAPPEVRRIVGEYFRQFLNALTGQDLRDEKLVRRVAVLIEAHPKDAGFLSAALERASDEEVQAISGAYGRGWGSRRTLVWLAEKLARYPMFFHDAELILWRLASNENETAGNNATALWRQLFRVYLSGAATPFSERVRVLRDRIETASGPQVSLAIGALSGILSDWMSRSGGTVYVGGRLAPEDWQPQTHGELRDAYSDSLALLRDQLTSSDEERQTLAKAVLTKAFWFLLTKGFLRDSFDLVESARFSELETLGLVRLARDYVSRESQPSTPEEKDYRDVIISWIDGRLRCVGHQRALADYLTQNEFQIHQETTKSSAERAEEMRHSARLAAKALIDDSKSVESNVALVSASNPYRAAMLGVELAHLDSSGTLFGPLLKECLLSSRSSLIGGYISARTSDSREFVDVLNSTIDKVAETSPQLAFELSNAAPRDSNALARALTWVNTGVLVPAYLKTFMFGVQGIPLSADETSRLLRVLMEHPDRSAKVVALEILGYLAHDPEETPLASEAIQAIAWHLVENIVKEVPAHNWADTVTMLAKVDAARATGLAIRGMLLGDLHLEEYAEQLSIELASRDPKRSLRLLGEMLVGAGTRPTFLINTCRPFVKSLPLELTKEWLQTVEIEVVRRFARNLEAPYLTSEGKPAVPPLTEYVLREFEGDDEVFESFYSGTHHLRAYSGDIARHHASEAAVAERFRNHHLRRVREWAEMEVERGTRWAEMLSQRNAEERSEEM